MQSRVLGRKMTRRSPYWSITLESPGSLGVLSITKLKTPSLPGSLLNGADFQPSFEAHFTAPSIYVSQLGILPA
jgi:hypothetical protein